MRYTIKDIKRWAKKRHGKCLSSHYKYGEKLTFKCNAGHVWKAEAYAIKRGRWCPVCGKGKRLDIEVMHKVAASRGGKCLSKKYLGCRTDLTWQCSEGHIWQATPTRIKNERKWCPTCAKENHHFLTFKQLKTIAKEHHGQCLSQKYEGRYKELKWRCSRRHVFVMTPKNVKDGLWCPRCSTK